MEVDSMNNYLERAKGLMPELLENRRHIHKHPEVGMELENTVAFVTEKLIEMGYEPKACGKAGIEATLGQAGGKVFLLRADMDALPMKEESGLDFASINPEAAHCCGHDIHTAMLLGAAKLLKEDEDKLDGMVKLMFQPAEETLEGARDMIQHGILENPSVDAAMAIHINALYDSGKVIVTTGPLTASSDGFTIKIKGHGGHGARPHECVDPINVACHIHSSLQAINAREVQASEHLVLNIGSIHGGNAGNVVPETVEMQGTLRTYSNEVRNEVKERIESICKNIAQAFRAEAEVVYGSNYTVPMICDENVAAEAENYISDLIGKNNVVKTTISQAASEDFAFIADRVPSTFCILGATIKKGTPYGQHHPKVVYDESAMPIGVAMYANVAREWLKNNQ